MMPHQKQSADPEDEKFPPADYGNASNPSPHPETAPANNQLLDKHAEKYLREVANIEDEPDAQDQEEMDETIEQEKSKSED
jgi:hypothetical protein